MIPTQSLWSCGFFARCWMVAGGEEMISDGGGVLFFKGFGVFVRLKELQCVFEASAFVGNIREPFHRL